MACKVKNKPGHCLIISRVTGENSEQKKMGNYGLQEQIQDRKRQSIVAVLFVGMLSIPFVVPIIGYFRLQGIIATNDALRILGGWVIMYVVIAIIWHLLKARKFKAAE
jgi:hypothetical protein